MLSNVVLQEKVKSWLNAALKKEEDNWHSCSKPELIDHYCFSPLAIDVIQVGHGTVDTRSLSHNSRVKDVLGSETLTPVL